MLEEKNDNLPIDNQEADGTQENQTKVEETLEESTGVESVAETVEEVITEVVAEPEVTEEAAAEPEVSEDVTTEPEVIEEPVSEITEEPAAEKVVEAQQEPVEEQVSEVEEADAEEAVVTATTPEPDEKQKALSAIEASNAEESEDDSARERQEFPEEDYSTFDMDTLVAKLEQLALVEKVMLVKDHIEGIKKEFLSQYNHFIEDKKEEFLHENPDTTEEFEYHLPVKAKFDQLYRDYKSRLNSHFKNLQNNLKANLEKREAIVEEIKNLINPQENIKDTLKHFNELRDQWKAIGPIPRDKYNHVWNNYHFHVENFYDYLHLDREARDLDFKHNLELKQKIIERVRELIDEEDIIKAFRELQDLHKIWKEDIGPVDREHREAIWNEFSELTKQMHDKREQLYSAIRERENENLTKKNEIIAGIKALLQETPNSHGQWQKLMEKVEQARKDFFAIGKVPPEVNENTWAEFKNAVREFNKQKNQFYKDIKKEQSDNLNKKMALVEKANALKDSEDFEATTPVMKQIQDEWKTIGHVPRKFSDKVWNEFKAACNHYFDRMKSQKSEVVSEEMEAFNKKKEYLNIIKEFQLTGNHKTDLEALKAHIEHWKSLGKVPFSRRHVEGKFNRILDVLFQKLSMSKNESEMLRFENKLGQLADGDDSRKLENEKIFIIRKIDELKSEIFQLENNIQFFSNAKDDNPLVKEVKKNIERHKQELTTWQAKLKKLRDIS